MGEQNTPTGNNPGQSDNKNQAMNKDQNQGMGQGQGQGTAPAQEQPHIEPNTQGIQGIEGAEESDEGDASWRGGGGSAASKQKTFTGGESDLEKAGSSQGGGL